MFTSLGAYTERWAVRPALQEQMISILLVLAKKFGFDGIYRQKFE